MGKDLHKADRVWLEDVLNTVGVGNLEVNDVTEEGFTLNFDPKELTAHQAQEMMAIAERDNRFKDYGVNVEAKTIFFNY